MLDQMQITLVELIDRQEVASSAFLADSLNISKRSVINYVKKVNELYPSLVLSNNKGYYLDSEILLQMRANEGINVSVGPTQRILFLIQKLLSNYRDKLRISDTSEELHYSESTIRADLYKVREMCAELDLNIHITKNSAAITGSELKKRHLYFRLFQPSFEKNIYDFSQLELFFPQYNSARLYALLVASFQKHGYKMSDYSIISTFYRILISMDRIFHGHIVDQELYLKFVREKDIAVANELAKEIFRQENLRFPEHELLNLAMLIAATNINPNADGQITVDNLENYLWPGCYELVIKLAHAIKAIYQVDIREDQPNFIRFALCIRALIRRLHADTETPNPYKNVKVTNPVAFDCAVFTADQIKAQYGLNVSEDEMAYLALCVGHIFEQQVDEPAMLNGLFVLPAYYDLPQVLFNFYKESLRQYMTAHLTTDLDSYEDLPSVDIIISTLQFPSMYGKRVVQINPIQNAQDRRKLYHLAEKGYNEKSLCIVRDLIASLSDDVHFYHNPPISLTRDTVLDFMVLPRIQEGVISEGFTEAVLHRERLSSTVIGPLAVPHTWDGSASRNTLSILISDVPIVWGRKDVRVVLLLTMREGQYANICLPILRLLAQLLENGSFAKSLVKCRTRSDFLDLMK